MGYFPMYISIVREIFPCRALDGRGNYFCLQFTCAGEMNMFTKKWMAVVAGAALTTGVAVSNASLPVGTIVVAREATEGPRGGDNERAGDRQRLGGRLHIEIPAAIVIAREASEGPRGGDNERPGDRRVAAGV
jgi:hypothetical protein